MNPTTLTEVAHAVAGRVVRSDGSAVVTGATIDSREVAEGDLFIALVGERSDGHDHAQQALAAGAGAVLAARDIGGPAVIVGDPFAALAPLAAATLAAMSELTVVGVTGSSGKTTTKDLLRHVLGAAGPVHANPGSFNNDIGLPLTVLRTPRGTRHLVLEYGARGPGHIRSLMAIACPDISVVLNVGTAHLGEFGSQEVLAAAKAELVAGEGIAVLNADDPRVRTMTTDRRVVLAGEASDADIRARDVALDEQGKAVFTLTVKGESAQVRLPLVGRHMVSNAVCAAAAALSCGLELEAVAQQLSSAPPASPWRMEVIERPGGVTIVNDAYNANPESMAAALRSLAALGAGRRRTWAVLGEMAELGEHAVGAHMIIAELIVELGIDEVVVVGADTGGLEALRAGTGGRVVADVSEALALLGADLRDGDVVLVKASRAAGLERVAVGLVGGNGQGGDP